ncbi:MAG TPA: phage tail protein [Kofleriaceae bacterium]|jgi:phage tail-like protein|nr:phage tail protein [Kofleriaceae bacterium]
MTTGNENRSYVAAHFALELAGVDDVGTVRSIEGGGLKADVMTYQPGATYERWRQLGKPKFEDIKLQIGTAMSKPFFQWIEGFFAGTCERKNGAIVAGDFYYKERARREFTEALITELTFPKLDAADKNTVYMNVTLGVENIEYKKGDESKTLEFTTNPESQKAWKACNFTFKLDGFEPSCDRVTKVDSFTIKLPVLEYHSGGSRSPTKTPTAIDFPNLSFYLPEADAQPITDHFKKRGIQGEVPGRLHGQLTTFDNAKTTKFTLELINCDILDIQPDKAEATTEEIKQVKVDIYVEQMKFTFGDPYPPAETGAPV